MLPLVLAIFGATAFLLYLICEWRRPYRINDESPDITPSLIWSQRNKHWAED